MGGHSKRSCSDYPEPEITPPVEPFYIVTGTAFPDCRGTYRLKGVLNEHNEYMREDFEYFLWFFTLANCWMINQFEGVPADPYWTSPTSEIQAVYIPGLVAAGNPIVTLG